MPRRPTDRKLNDREILFVQEYPVDLNATQAAGRAGYSLKTAGSQGARLLKRVEIQKAITVAFNARAVRTEISQDMVLRELALLAFSDMGVYATWGPTGVTLKASDELPAEASRAVAEVSEHVTESGSTMKFKLHDKRGSLELLMRHLGMLVERSLHEFTGDLTFTVEFETPSGKIIDAAGWALLEEAEDEADEADGP